MAASEHDYAAGLSIGQSREEVDAEQALMDSAGGRMLRTGELPGGGFGNDSENLFSSTFLNPSSPIAGALAATGLVYGAGLLGGEAAGGAAGAVEPWMGTVPAVETGGSALAPLYTGAGAVGSGLYGTGDAGVPGAEAGAAAGGAGAMLGGEDALFAGATYGNAPGIGEGTFMTVGADAAGGGEAATSFGGGGGLDFGSSGEVFPGAAGDFSGAGDFPGGGIDFPSGSPTGGGVDYGGENSFDTGEMNDVLNPEEPDAWTRARTIASSTLDRITGAISNNPLTAASLGLTGYNMANQRNTNRGVPQQLQALAAPSQANSAALVNQANTGPLSTLPGELIGQSQTGTAATMATNLNNQAANGPVAQTSNSLLQQYQSGQINPGAAFDIDRWRQEQINQARSYYARAGMSDSTSAQNAIRQIEAQANAMRDTSRQGLLTSGLSAFTANNQLTGQALQAQQLAQQMVTQGLNAEQIRQNLLNMGLHEDQVSQALTVAAVQQQAQQDQQFSQSQQSALQSLLLLTAMSQRTGAAATPATAS